MKGAVRIATFFQIPLRIHWTFGLIFIYVLYLGSTQSWKSFEMIWAMGFMLALFTCVVLHEYGHALMARRFGVSTRDIVLSPIGGVARLNRLPEKPLQEFLIAIAGPLVNIGISLILLPRFLLLPDDVRTRLFWAVFDRDSNYFLPELSYTTYFLFGLFFLNLILAAFNLLPAFPMDGGRILRALLAFRIGRLRATHISARIGQVFAALFVLNGLFNLYQSQGQEGYLYIFIGFFVFTTAAGEYRMVAMEHRLESGRVKDLARRRFTPVYLHDSMSEVIRLFDLGSERNFLVFDRWHNLVAVLPEQSVAEALKKGDAEAQVAHYMVTEILPLREEESLKDAFSLLQYSRGGMVPVFNQWNDLVGVLEYAGLNQYLNARKRA